MKWLIGIATVAILAVGAVDVRGQTIRLFGPDPGPGISAEMPAPILHLFDGPPSAPPVLDLFASDTASDPPKDDEHDDRPVVDAYSIDGCRPCDTNQRQIGEGDARVRVRWHHCENGQAFPWHIHNHALVHGYPAYYFRDGSGQWRRTSGTRSLDELARLVGRGVKIAAR